MQPHRAGRARAKPVDRLCKLGAPCPDEPGKTVSAAIISTVARTHPELAVDFAQANRAAVDGLIDAASRARFVAALAAWSNDPAMIAKLEAIAAPLPADARKPYDKTIASLKERGASRPRIKGEIAAWLKGN